jgi:hypothetical protein
MLGTQRKRPMESEDPIGLLRRLKKD